MQKFTEFVKEQKQALEAKKRDSKITESEKLFNEKLKDFGVESILELDETQFKTLKESIIDSTIDPVDNVNNEDDITDPISEDVIEESADEFLVTEKDVKDEKTFRSYAETVLKKAHGDEYDKEIAKKTIDGIIDKSKEDWGAAIGMLTSGLGS